MTHSFWEENLTSSNAVLKGYEYDMAFYMRMLGYPTRETAESNNTVQQTPESWILTLQLQTKYSDL